MTTAAIILASVSLLVAGASLGWQIANYLLTGARVKVDLCRAVVGYPTGAERVVSVEARNIGRHSVEVRSVYLRLADSHGYFPTRKGVGNPDLPYTLDAGHSLSYLFALSEINDALRENKLDGTVRGAVTLGTGKAVYSEVISVAGS